MIIFLLGSLDSVNEKQIDNKRVEYEEMHGIFSVEWLRHYFYKEIQNLCAFGQVILALNYSLLQREGEV